MRVFGNSVCRQIRCAIVLTLGSTLVCESALAESALAESAPPPSSYEVKRSRPPRIVEERESYETAMLLAHAIPFAAMWAVTIVNEKDIYHDYYPALGAAAGSMVLLPPAAHASQGQWGRGAASFSIELVLSIPPIFALFGPEAPVKCHDKPRCDHPTFVPFAVAHTLLQPIATMIDVAMATKERS